MAILLATASGNLTAAGTWKVSDTVSGSSYLLGLTSTVVPTTPGTGTDSPSWTGDGSTVDGILLRMASRAASPSGTLTVILRKTNGTPSDLRTVTINIADLPAAGNGWVFFKFSSAVTLLSTDTHVVRVYSSVASQVNLLAGASNNWNRILRTTTTQAPVAGDQLFIQREYTGQGASITLTVTMNSTASTDYGKIDVSTGGTLAFGTAASTSYVLRTSGLLEVWGDGALHMGTVATPMPGTSTAVLEFDNTVDGEFGLVIQPGGTFVGQGASKTYDRALLAADAGIGATTITTDVATGWAVADLIAIADTSRPGLTGKSESRTISSIAGTSITVGALTNAHDGTSPTQAEVVNLSRNVKIRAVTTAFVTYLDFKSTATVDLDWVEVSAIGANAVGKRGIEIETTSGSVSLNRCAVYTAEVNGIYIDGGGAVDNVTLTNNVCFDLAKTAGPALVKSATTGLNITISGNVILNTNNNLYNVLLSALAGVFTNNVIVGGDVGIRFAEKTGTPGTFTGNTVHSTQNAGILFETHTIRNLVLTQTKIYRVYAHGIIFGASLENALLDDLTVFGCGTTQLVLGRGIFGELAGTGACRVTILNGTFAGDATYGGPVGLKLSGTIVSAIAADWVSQNCKFGVVEGTGGNQRIAFSTADIDVGDVEPYATITLLHCALASSVEVRNPGNLSVGSYIRAQRLDQTNQKQRTWFKYGTVEMETVAVGGRTPPHEKLTPSHATAKLESAPMAFALGTGQTIAPKVYARKTATYNGAQLRLIRKRNDALFGPNDSDQVAATMTVGADTWEQLVGVASPAAVDDGVVEYVVDGAGTAGSFYVDDWSE